MGRQLYSTYSQFRDSIDRMDKVYEASTGHSLIKHIGIFADVQAERSLPEVWPIKFTLPALAMLQMALFDLLGHFGITPDVVEMTLITVVMEDTVAPGGTAKRVSKDLTMRIRDTYKS